MVTSYRLHRSITVSGFSADANPNVTTPTAPLFSMSRQVEHDGIDRTVRGYYLYGRFVDATGAEVTGATFTFTPWLKDYGASAEIPAGGATAARAQFVQLDASQAAQPDAKVYYGKAVGDLWVQVTALGSTGSAVTLEIWICEREDST